MTTHLIKETSTYTRKPFWERLSGPSLMICQVTRISSNLLVSHSNYKVPGTKMWGMIHFGLVFGLGMSGSALSKAGSIDTIHSIKCLLTSWIGEVQSVLLQPRTQSSKLMLATGAFLVVPIVASFCRKVELMRDNELNDLFSCFENVICKLQLDYTSNIFHSYLLMSSCIGAGSSLSFILD